MSKTIREIWNGTPYGKAITDPSYINLIKYIETAGIPYTIIKLNRIILGLWNRTPEDAMMLIEVWLGKEIKLNPNFLQDMRTEENETF